MIDRIRQDLRYTLRTYVRSPGFTLLAILTIGVGIGASTAIFSVVDAVLLRPLPFANPDELVVVSQTDKTTNQRSAATPANFLDWRARNHAFAGMSALRDQSYVLTSGDRPERVGGGLVNANFFDVLGVRPMLGRGFAAGEEGPGAPRTVILAEGLWKRRFGGRADVIGQTIRINDELHTVIGVMPAAIDYPDRAELWTTPHWRVPDDPLAPAQDPSPQRDHDYFSAIARLKPSVTLAQARSDMTAVALGLEHDYPILNRNAGAAVIPLHQELVADARQTILVLFAAVGIVLLIAVVNVAGLLVARATVRHQEIAVRMALGATRRQITGQLLTESVVLGLVGGGCGLLLSMWMVAPFVAINPAELGATGDVHMDLRVMGFAAAMSIVAGIAFGLLPLRQLIDRRLHDDLKRSGRGTSGAQRRMRAGLVSAQVALSLVLLVSAGLAIKSLIRLERVPTGFDADGVVTASVSLPPQRYDSPAARTAFWDRALDALRAVPGIEVVAAANRPPLSGGNSARGLTIDGRNTTPPAGADYRTVTPGYFRALGIPILRGRPIEDDDRDGRPLVAVISASMAARYWPGADPIGHVIAINAPQPMTVVGVVGDVHHASLEAAPKPTFYVPARQDPWSTLRFVLRTPTSADALRRPIEAAIARVDKEQPVGAVLAMNDLLSRSVARRRLSVTLLTAFGTVAVMLAAVGLYAVLAFIVGERRREIGVRMALGAQPRAIIAGLLGHGLRLAAVGVTAGVALAMAATRLLNALLFGTSPTDAATYAGAAALVAAIAAAASLGPALRASRVDPLVALREE